MNKIYRLVWNKYLGLWTVVSELARGTTKKRNVSVETTAALSPPLNANSLYTKSHLTPVILATVMGSIFYSSHTFAGYEAGGGSTYNNCTAGVVGSGTKSGNSVAVGNGSCAAGNGGISMGSRADSSTAPNNIAMGSNAKTGSRVSGTTDAAPLNGGSQIAIGKNAQTDTAGSIAIGNDARTGVGQNFGVAIGGYAEATGNSAIAFGRRTDASGFGGVAVGAYAQSSGNDSTAVGSNATASKQAATALGNQANAVERGSTAVGFGANAVTVGAVAVGVNSYAAGRIKDGEDWESSAFGSNSRADGAGAVALGNYSKATADETLAAGNGAQATSRYAAAIGTLAEATAEEAVATGHQSKAQSFADIAIGSDAATVAGTGGKNIAIGNKVTTGAIGQNVAIGSGITTANSSTADGGAVAIGRDQVATGDGAVAIGDPNIVNGDGAIVLGKDNIAAGDLAGTTAANGAVAIGNTNQAIGQGSVALGNISTAAAAGAIALGDTANAAAATAIALGTETQAQNEGDIAIGRNAQASGEIANGIVNSAVAIGANSIANQSNTIALGNETEATGASSSAIGSKAWARGIQSTAIGNLATANGNYSIAQGADVEAAGHYSIAVGSYAKSEGVASLALGNLAKAEGDASVAQGNQAEALGNSSIATGDKAKAQSDNDIALGNSATTVAGTSGDNIAIGNAVTTGATGKNVAIGSDGTTANSESADGGAVAIGRDQIANGDGAVAIGDPNRASGSGAVALGKDNTAAGDTAASSLASGAVAIGNTNQAIGQGSVALGNTSTAAAAGAIALGDTANAQATRGVALGSGATATNADDVALGAGSVTSAANPTANGTVGGITYNYAGTSPSSVVSVGSEGNERQVTNVAAGRVSETSTDAINGSQLYSTQQALGKLAESTANHLGGGSVVNPDGTISAPSYIVNETPINNVGDAIEALDQGWNLQSNGAGGAAIKAGDTVDIGTADGEENLTVTKTGNDIKYALNRNLKVDSVTAGDTVINTNGVTINNGPSITNSGIDAAGHIISNVGAGVAGTDAVNKSQLDAATAAGKNTVTDGKNITVTESANADGSTNYEVATADDVDFNNMTVGDVTIDGTTGKISGVTAGDVTATSTDAINGSQLAGTAKSVSDALGGGSVVNPDGTVTAPSYDINGTTVGNVGDALSELDKGWNLQSNGAKAGAVKAGDTVDIGTVNGEENLSVTKDGNTIQYGLNRNLNVDSVRAGDTLVNDNGVTITNGPSITKDGINAAGNPISNVGAGVNDSDAVNKGQLDDAAAAAKTEVTQGKNITVSKTTGADGQDIYNVATADNVEFNNVVVGDVTIDGTTGKISGVTAGDVTATSTDAINGSQLAGTAKSVSDALGGGSVVNPDGTVTAPSYDINGTTVGNVGDALSELDKGWNLQSNGAKAGAVKAGDTVDIGTVNGEENLTVTKNGNTIQYGLNKDLRIDSVRAGDTLINDNGVTITNGPSITKDGINAAGNPISNVGAGVNDSDAVNKGQLDDAAAAAKTEVTQGKNITVSKTTGADGQDIYNVATADNVEFNNVTVGDVTIDGTTGKISGVAAGDVTATSTDAINGSQLHGVADSVRNSIGGETTLNPDGSIGTSNVGNTGQNNIHDAINSVRGQAAAAKTEVEAGKNMTVESRTGADGQTIYEVATADDVAFDSVQVGDVTIDGTTGKISGVAAGDVNPSSTDAINGSQLAGTAQSVSNALGGGSVVNPDGTVTAPSYNVNGVASNNVGDAINALDKGWNLQSNGSDNAGAVKAGDTVDIGTVQGEENLTVSKDGNTIQYGLNRDLKVDSVTAGDTVINDNGVMISNGPSITKAGIDVAGNKISNVAPGTVGTDAVNKDQLDSAAAASKTEVTEGKNITVTKTTGADGQDIYNVATADNVEFNNVTVGDVNIDGATGKISGVADGAVAAGSSEAINGGQLHGVADSVRSAIGGETVLNPNGSVTTSNVGNTGEANIHDAIDSVRKNAVTAKTTVTEGDNMVVTESTNADGSTNYEVATARDVDFDSIQVGDVAIDGTTGKISGVTAGDVNPTSTDVINGSQLAGTAQSVSGALGGGSIVNPDGTVTAPNYEINGISVSNVGDALTELDKGWNLQSNGSNNAGAVKAGDTVDIGTVQGEENLTVSKDGNTIQYGLNRDLKVDSVMAGDTLINTDGITISNGPSITKTGIDAAGNPITNVADGTASSDAVNKGQLDRAAAVAKTEVEAGKNMTVESRTGADGQTIYEVATADNVAFDSVQVGDVTIDGATGKISGVADGTVAAGSSEAINGGQLHGVADSVRNSIGGETILNPNGSVTTSNVGNTGEANIHDAIDSVRKNAVTAKTTVTEGDNIVVTESTNADGSTNYDVATAKDVKFDRVTATDADGNETVLNATGTQVKDAEGNQAEYAAKGISLKDQLGNGTVINQAGIGFVDATGNNIGPSISAAGIDAGNTVIRGVAAGRIATDSQDAINGSQLKGVADSVAGAIGGNTTVNPDGSISTSNIGGTGQDNINDAIGAVGKAAQAAKTTVSKAAGDENVTVTSRQNADGSTDYEVGLSKDVKVDSVTAGDTVLNDDGLRIAGGPSVTKAGIDAGDNKVTGVADGTVAAGSKDAVNGGQLHGVADSVKNVVGGNATVNPDGSITTSNVGGTGENNIDDAINSVRGAAAAAKSTVSNKDGNILVTPTTKADGSKDFEVGLAKDIQVDSVAAANQVNVGGAGGTTIAADGVRITGGPSITKGGVNAGNQKVTAVADGAIAADSKDAINGSQLHQSYENVGKALGGGAGYDPSTGWTAPSYEVGGNTHNNVGDALNALNNADQALGDRITNLGDQMQQAFYDTNQRIDDVKKMANAGVAAAMALETAPYISGKYTYAVGAAYHGGENAVGLTLRKTADNGRWSLTTGVAAASQGDPSFRVGLSGVFD
ncbi:hypothetical protein GCM10025882_01700 [Acinetobacter gyllenbergii]|nr:ESPR-type extended signal peptide-containing protein [Acinetobacter gyllenbergii]GMA09746.1 hypothetical protein GCM10025882_01700 [Acinetobacter gyllenbergii]